MDKQPFMGPNPGSYGMVKKELELVKCKMIQG